MAATMRDAVVLVHVIQRISLFNGRRMRKYLEAVIRSKEGP